MSNFRASIGACDASWRCPSLHVYIQSGIPPKTIDDLPAFTLIVPVYCYGKGLECNIRGPNLTARYRFLGTVVGAADREG